MRVIRAEQLTRATEPHSRLEEHCVHTARCAIAGVTMELCTDMPDVARLFALRYADHPAASPADFRYYVATVRGGYAFWCAHATSWRWSQGPLPPDAVAFLADTVAMNALVRYDPDIASLHAGAVEFRGIAAILSGTSPAQKTATLLACARRGMRVYSDERALLRGDIVQPFLRRSSVRIAGARLLLSDRDAAPGCDARFAPELSLKTFFGRAGIAHPRPLRALFVLEDSTYCASLEEIDVAAALPSITRWFDARGDTVDRVARAIGVLQETRCFRLLLGAPDENAAAIAYAMGRITTPT